MALAETGENARLRELPPTIIPILLGFIILPTDNVGQQRSNKIIECSRKMDAKHIDKRCVSSVWITEIWFLMQLLEIDAPEPSIFVLQQVNTIIYS